MTNHDGQKSHNCKHSGESLCFVKKCKASNRKCYKVGNALEQYP